MNTPVLVHDKKGFLKNGMIGLHLVPCSRKPTRATSKCQVSMSSWGTQRPSFLLPVSSAILGLAFSLC